jgi:hypothetical protein
MKSVKIWIDQSLPTDKLHGFIAALKHRITTILRINGSCPEIYGFAIAIGKT